MRKKFISCLLMFSVIITSFSIVPITSYAANTTLTALQQKFPHGKYWNGGNADSYTSSPCTHHNRSGRSCSHSACADGGYCCYYGNCGCNSFANSIQCYGFANKLAYDYYGSVPTSSWSTVKNLNSLKAGDVIRYSGHSVWVTNVSGNTVTYADCNSDLQCKIRWNVQKNKSGFTDLKCVYVAPYAIDDSSTKPNIPTLANVTVDGTNVTVYWTAVSGATQYIVDFCKVVNGAYNHDYYETTNTSMTKTLSYGEYAIRVCSKNSAGESGYTAFWYIDVFAPIHIAFDANGGTLEGTKARFTYSSLNGGRGENQLVIYTNSGSRTGTNIYGTEVLVDSSNRVTKVETRVGNATVPYGGFILSGHGVAQDNLYYNVNEGDYVNLHHDLQSAWIWTENGWLTWTKRVKNGGIYGNLPVPFDREGYEFIGWFTAAEGGTQITSDTTVTVTSEQTLYAHWEKQAYTISYDLNGADGAIEPQTFENCSNAYISSIKPTRSGYIFLGWARSASATEAEFQPSDEYTENTDITLYAVWKILPSTETSITKKSAYSLINTTVKNAENGNLILIATYKNGKMSDLQTEAYTGEDISVATFLPYDNVKVMIFDSLKSLKPLSIAETISN